MNTRLTPILATPLLILVSVPFALGVYEFSGKLYQPQWIPLLISVLAFAYASSSSSSRFDYVKQQNRTGGQPPMSALYSVMRKQSVVLLVQLGCLLFGYILTARYLPRNPLHILGLFPHTETGTDFFIGEAFRWLLGCAASGFVNHTLGRMLFPDDPFQPQSRGRRLRTFVESSRIADSGRPADDAGLSWGGCRLPSSVANLHWLVCGTTGSGKTMLQRLLMQDALSRICHKSDTRALIYDAKHDVYSLLKGMKLSCPVRLLNPMDQRCVAWDIARDCNNPATAVQLSHVLISDHHDGPNAFFTKGARDLLAGVILAFILHAPGRWSLRDVIFATSNEDSLRELLGRSPHTNDRLRYFSEPRTLANLLSTLAAELAPFVPIAAAWDHAVNKVSLEDWVRGEFVLVLGCEEAVRAPLDAINRAIFQRAVELILAQPDNPTRRTWVFLDEVREAGKLDGLRSLLNKGRSKGACVVLGFQAIEGLWDAYGKEAAEELAGECNHKALLRVESPETAEWASRVVGEYEAMEIKKSQGPNGGPPSLTEDIVRRPSLLPSEFTALPVTNPTNGLTGAFVSPVTGAYRHTLSGSLLSQSLIPPDCSVPDYLPRPDSQQYLRPWDADDRTRLGWVLAPQHNPHQNPTIAVPKANKLKVVGNLNNLVQTP